MCALFSGFPPSRLTPPLPPPPPPPTLSRTHPNQARVAPAAPALLHTEPLRPPAVCRPYSFRPLHGRPLACLPAIHSATELLRRDFVNVYVTDCAVWPAAMVVAFTKVPVPLRPLYCSAVGVFWNAFLSHTSHAADEEDDDEEASPLPAPAAAVPACAHTVKASA